MTLFNSSTSPIAAMRGASLGILDPSPSPVVPSSPVRVAMTDKRLAMGFLKLIEIGAFASSGKRAHNKGSSGKQPSGLLRS
ncbi:MAG: hypothetical protein ACN6P8_15290, partial [Achromobacter piechaudii]